MTRRAPTAAQVLTSPSSYSIIRNGSNRPKPVSVETKRELVYVEKERRAQAEHLEALFERGDDARQKRRNTPAERVLALSNALADPNLEISRAIISREITVSVPRLGTLAFVRRTWQASKQMTLLSAVLGSGLIKRANELVGQSIVDARLLPRLAAAYTLATQELRETGIALQVIKTAYDGVELGAVGHLGNDELGHIHMVLERRVRQVLAGFHLALDIQLADLDFAITVGAAIVEAPSFFAMLTAHMHAGGAAKAARVKGGFSFHSVEHAIDLLRAYRRWVEESGVTKIGGMPAVVYDPIGGRLRVNLDLITAQRSGALAPAAAKRLAPVSQALNVLDWVHYQRSDRLLEEAGRAKTALDWLDRLADSEPFTPELKQRLEEFMTAIHPRLSFVRASTTGPATAFVVDMKKLGPRGLSICERVASELLEREMVTAAGLDAARFRQNDLIQDLKQVLDAVVEVARAKSGEGAQLFVTKGGDDVIIGVRRDGAPLSHELRWAVAATLAAIAGVRIGVTEISGDAATLDQEIGLLEQRMSETLKKVERLDSPGRFFLDDERIVTVAL